MSLRLARRGFLSLPFAVAAETLIACGPSAPPPKPPAPPETPLALASLADLVKAPGLTWLVEASPRRALADDDLLAATTQVVPDERFRAYTKANAGIDPRSLEELVVARYADATLTLARGVFDPSAVHRAFEARATHVDGRAVDVKNPEVVRLFGDGAHERMQLVTFGRTALGLEVGRFGPLRVAELYAQGKLHKAKPALKAAPLDRIAALLGPSEARFFAAGPFEGEWEKALGGLLRASTGMGVGVKTKPGGRGRLDVVLVVLGGFEKAPEDAARRFGALLDVMLAKSALGRLLGLDTPLESPRVVALPDALRVEAAFDGLSVARGLHHALDAEIFEIMGTSK